jgi:STE24 endopeptidase
MGRIPKTVMEDIPSDPIGGSKTKFRSVSPARKLRSDPGFPHTSLREMSHARPALITVFSTTQFDHSIAKMISCHHGFGNSFDLLCDTGDDILKAGDSTVRTDKIHPLLDQEKQTQAIRYEKEKRLLGLLSLCLSLAFLLAFYFSGWSSRLAHLFPDQSVIYAFIVYVIVFQTALFVFGFPLSYYSGYIHEHKWRFSNHTKKSWLWEQMKSTMVGFIIFLLLLGMLFWILERYPHEWWWIAGIAMAFVSAIFATLFPVVILPIFNKYTPIEDHELTDPLENILSEGGLKSSGFFMEDMSRQTKKENAFLAGLGRTRRVVLGDNLMDNMTVPEIVAIIAHEVGHYQHRHIWKHIVLGTLQQLVVFYSLNIIMKAVFPAFLTSTRANLALFPFFAILMGGLSGFLFGPLSNALSRHFERQADRYALTSISDKDFFITALVGLANRNLANAYPAWWVKLLYYSHPPIGERLLMAERAGSV